jgi:hypothetical protein
MSDAEKVEAPQRSGKAHGNGIKARPWYRSASVWFSVASLVVALCSAVFTGLAVKEANRAANEAAAGNEINRRAQRAFVFINRAELTPFKEGEATWWAFSPIWENSGNTPPVDGHMYVNQLPELQALRPGFSKCQIGDSVQPLISVAPHGTTNVSALNLNGSALTLFKNGQRNKFYIWGWFTYKDTIVNEPHMTRFCWDVKRVIGNPDNIENSLKLIHMLCNEGNCFDDDCKENINGALKLPDIPGCHIDVRELPPAR